MSGKKPTKYRKKPVVVEAMRWDGTAEGATPIINWALQNDGSVDYFCVRFEHGRCVAHDLRVRTLEGLMHAKAGDFIVRGTRGEFYPCKPDAFADTFDEVSS